MFENAVDLWNSNITRLVLVEQSWSPEAMSDVVTFKKSSIMTQLLIKQLPIERVFHNQGNMKINKTNQWEIIDDDRTHPKHVPRD